MGVVEPGGSAAIRHVRQFTREAAAASPNARGNKRSFKHRDIAKSYCGISSADAAKRGQKAKPCSHCRPGVIVEAYPEHPPLFKTQCDSTKSFFIDV